MKQSYAARPRATVSAPMARGNRRSIIPSSTSSQQATSALNQAQSNRILRTAVAEIVKTRDPQLISGLAGSGMLGSGNPQSTTSLDLINSLQGQIATQQAAVNSEEVVFGDSYPELIQDRAQYNHCAVPFSRRSTVSLLVLLTTK